MKYLIILLLCTTAHADILPAIDDVHKAENAKAIAKAGKFTGVDLFDPDFGQPTKTARKGKS